MAGSLAVAAPSVLTGGVDGQVEELRRLPESAARSQAARQLAVEFLSQLLSAMRKTVPKDDFLPKAPSRDVYEGLFDHAVAENMAKGDPLGLEQVLGRVPGTPANLKFQKRSVEKESGPPGSPGATVRKDQGGE